MQSDMTVLARADVSKPRSIELVRDPEGKVGLAVVEDGAWEIIVPVTTPESAVTLAVDVMMGTRAALTGQHTIRILAAHLLALTAVPAALA